MFIKLKVSTFIRLTKPYPCKTLSMLTPYSYHQLISESQTAFQFIEQNSNYGFVLYQPDTKHYWLSSTLQFAIKKACNNCIHLNTITKLFIAQLLKRSEVSLTIGFAHEEGGRKSQWQFEVQQQNFITSVFQEGIHVAVVTDVRCTTHQRSDEKIDHPCFDLETLQAATALGLWCWDIPSDRLMMNEHCAAMLGYSVDEIQQLTQQAFKAWIHPNDYELATKAITNHAQGKTSHYEIDLRLKHKTGKWIWVLDRGKVVEYNEHGLAVKMIGYHIDITERKQTEQMFEGIFKQSAAAICMLDDNMRYIAASGKWINDYHLGSTSIVGKSHYEVFPEISDEWKAIHQRCLKGEVISSDEDKFIRADGSIQWIMWEVRPWYKADDNIGGLIISSSDITHIKERDGDKLRIERILNETNEVARIGTWEVDLRSNRVIWSKITKEIHEAITDYTPDLETAINFYKEGSSRNLITTKVNDAILYGIPYDIEVELITMQGNYVWCRSIGKAEFANGVCTRLYGVFQDISERKKNEERLQSLLNIANKQNESLRSFAHIVSHNLRSHASNISMLIDAIGRDFPEITQNTFVQLLSKASNNLLDTITNLQEIVRGTATQKESLVAIQLQQPLETALAGIRGLITQHQVTLNIDIPANTWVMGILPYLDSIFLNLITNAIKYRSPQRKAIIALVVTPLEHEYQIRVTDNGLGIDLAKHEKRIFGLHETFHGNADAKGIGLFITKHQIESMGGRIEVESTVDAGSSFTFYLKKATTA